MVRSYRVQLIWSVLSLLLVVVPLFYLSRAVEPLLADDVQDFFGYVAVGLCVFFFLQAATKGPVLELQRAIHTGTFEAYLATPIRLPVLLAGLSGFAWCWALVRGMFVLVLSTALGADFVWALAVPALVVSILLAVGYLGIGYLGAASVIAFRSDMGIPSAALYLTALLGGVYYPPTVAPKWAQGFSSLFPSVPALGTVRQMFLKGTVDGVGLHLLHVAVYSGVLLGIGTAVVCWSVRRAAHRGDMVQY